MSHAYRAVSWTRHKKLYDLVLALLVVGYLAAFVTIGLTRDPETTLETQLIRALGTCAFLMLHVILSIGPLCRLNDRFLPLLFNRRHLGVSMFLVALAHGLFSIIQFHTLGVRNPLVSVLSSNGSYDSISQFPFQPLGLAALTILFLMAATSHDFWLANLSAPVWKRLHMAVYVAYGLLVLHVALGSLQAERALPPTVALVAGLVWLAGLHLIAGFKERRFDGTSTAEAATAQEFPGYHATVFWYDIQPDRARIVTLAGERVAILRHGDRGQTISAISNVCQHQNGPLGEGKVVDGCITCPWHGFQYEPTTGASPPPFTEKVPTFDVALVADRVLVNPVPNPPGTAGRPAIVSPEQLQRAEEKVSHSGKQGTDDFYVGYLPDLPAHFRAVTYGSILLCTLLAFGLSFLVSSTQQPADQGFFDFGNSSSVEGTLSRTPYPVLYSEDGARILVAQGKHGAQALLDKLSLEHGSGAKLAGTAVDSEVANMLELTDGQPTPSRQRLPEERSLGQFQLNGEIVDSKCYLGVMKPGRGKPHRACAALCIEGGIPPALLVRTAGAAPRRMVLLLVGLDDQAIGEALLPLVTEPVRLAGEVLVRGDLLVMKVDPKEISRL